MSGAIGSVVRRIGPVASRLLAPGYGSCGRCRIAWLFVDYHTTNYGAGRGMFPLCEGCWSDLGTPEARLPHYWALWLQWEKDVPWSQIEAAVFAEAAPQDQRGES